MKNMSMLWLIILLGSRILTNEFNFKSVLQGGENEMSLNYNKLSIHSEKNMKAQILSYFLLKDKTNGDTIVSTGMRMDFKFEENSYKFKHYYAIQREEELYCTLEILKDSPVKRQSGDILTLTFFLQLKIPSKNSFFWGRGFSNGYVSFGDSVYTSKYINVAGGQRSLEGELVFNTKTMVLIKQSLRFVEHPNNPSDKISKEEIRNRVVSLFRFTKEYARPEIATKIIWSGTYIPFNGIDTGFIRN